jgi:predicted anti-sigma-YlaC factor YlaD
MGLAQAVCTDVSHDRFLTSGRALVVAACLVFAVSGCSVRNLAVNSMGDALAASGSGFASDDDPDLIGAAAPFSLKLMESVLAETPNHRGLLLAVTQGFVQYSYAYVEMRADELEDTDVKGAYAQRERARRLYLRARNYGLRGLEAAHPELTTKALKADAGAALKQATVQDVPTLYWTGVAWAAAVSLAKDDAFLIADLPVAEALVRRALELEETYDFGGIHVFLISYEMSRAGLSTEAPVLARRHFARAVELSGGLQAAPYVTLAESVSISQRNRKEFEQMLQRALKVDTGARPEWRLVNLVMQRRARWLLDRTDKLFAD